MEIFTSRWANRDLAHLDVVPVGISRGVPRWRTPYSYRLLRLLAPSRKTFALEDLEEYEASYLAGLDEIAPERIATEFHRISQEHGGRPLALLCFENVLKGEKCHRRTFAAWLEERTGQEVPELAPGMVLPGTSSPALEALFEYE